jgi:hypothetical protein
VKSRPDLSGRDAQQPNCSLKPKGECFALTDNDANS